MAALLALALAGAPGRDAAWAAALPPGEARLPAGSYQGPWTLGRGVRLIAAPGAVLAGGDPVLSVGADDVTVTGLEVHAGGVGIAAKHVRGLVLDRVSVSGGKQGIYLSETQGRIAHARLTGTDYGVLTWRAQVEIADTQVARVRRAGVAMVRSSGTIDDCSFDGPFLEAAISSVGSIGLVLRHNRVRRAGAIGLKLVSSRGELAENDVSGARADPLEGDDVYLFDSETRARGDRLSDSTGTGLTVLGGTARVTACTLTHVGEAAAYVGERGRLELLGCTIEQAVAGLVVEPGSTGLAEGTKFLHVGADAGLE